MQQGADEATSSNWLCAHTPMASPHTEGKMAPPTDAVHRWQSLCSWTPHSEAFPSLGLTTVWQPGIVVCLYWLESSVRHTLHCDATQVSWRGKVFRHKCTVTEMRWANLSIPVYFKGHWLQSKRLLGKRECRGKLKKCLSRPYKKLEVNAFHLCTLTANENQDDTAVTFHRLNTVIL